MPSDAHVHRRLEPTPGAGTTRRAHSAGRSRSRAGAYRPTSAPAPVGPARAQPVTGVAQRVDAAADRASSSARAGGRGRPGAFAARAAARSPADCAASDAAPASSAASTRSSHCADRPLVGARRVERLDPTERVALQREGASPDPDELAPWRWARARERPRCAGGGRVHTLRDPRPVLRARSAPARPSSRRPATDAPTTARIAGAHPARFAITGGHRNRRGPRQ